MKEISSGADCGRIAKVPSYDNRFSLARGRLHLTLQIGGVRIGYAYIRKNGCSAFKRAIGYESSVSVEEIAGKHPFGHGHHDATIFVWRDPVERLASLYKNKILDRRNAGDILGIYRECMGEEPSGFERFVEFACMEKDPHCWTQKSHLMRVRYTHAIPLNCLHEVMCSIVGGRAAEPFAVRENASGRHQFEMTDRAVQMIRRHYAEDYRMIGRISRNHGPCPPRVD